MGQGKSIPDDFPREDLFGALPGLQPKIGVRLVDGTVVEGLTEDELYTRYDACEDLVIQLVGYCERKLQVRPEWDLPTLLTKVRGGVGQKGWGVSPAELSWIMC
ncbi:hypothetical protein [Variovorax sp. KK3]|uniref:hypothetical protein n=1 Tax=Variovorax sp. KK3 TaxID=1855728 RepID=UPI00097C9B1D|nr:hypothetical protein [Variovorax sp. KK3]